MRQRYLLRAHLTQVEVLINNGEVEDVSPLLIWLKGRKFAFLHKWCRIRKYDLVHVKTLSPNKHIPADGGVV